MLKLKILIGFACITFFMNCSSDDDSNDNVAPIDDQKKLLKIESTGYYGDNIMTEKIVRYFSEGKLVVDSAWNLNDNLIRTTKYYYNSNGLIINQEFESFTNGLTAEWNYEYDSDGRLINYHFLEEEPGFNPYERTIEYDYVSSSLITASYLESGNSRNIQISNGNIVSNGDLAYTFNTNNDLATMYIGGSQEELITVNYSQLDILGGFNEIDYFYNGNRLNFQLTAGTIPYAGESYFGSEKTITSIVRERNGTTATINYQHSLDEEGYLSEEIQTSVGYNDDFYSSKYYYE